MRSKNKGSKKRFRFKYLPLLLVFMLVLSLFVFKGIADAEVNRLGGADRYETSALVARDIFPTASTVIIARGDQAGNFADGLASSVLSGVLEAPILLTGPNTLPYSIERAIKNMGATRAIILGGKAAISSSVETALRDLGLTLTRIEGQNRYETAARIAREAKSKGYIEDYAFIVNGFATADSLVAAPAAFNNNAVILQVTRDSIPAVTKGALSDLGIKKVYIIGGTAVVSRTVERELEKLYSVERYGGDDRYETSVLVAKGLFPWANHIVLSGGPDAHLVDSIGASMFGRPILYVRNNEIPRGVKNYLEDTVTAGSDLLIIGGTSAISKSVERTVDNILGDAGGGYTGGTTITSTTVKTPQAFGEAIENKNIKTITLGADISGSVTATRSGTTNLTINFKGYRLTGSLEIIANNITTLNLNGKVPNEITGNLTVTANKATVTNSLSVQGTTYIKDVSSGSWYERVDGNRIILTDDNGATIIIDGEPGSVTVAAGAGDGINIIVNRPVTITVEDGADVDNITVAGTAAGTSITNNGTIGTVIANGDVEIENNNPGDSGQINVSGPGTATVSGEGADQVTGVVSAVTITAKVDENEVFGPVANDAEVTVTLKTENNEGGVTFYYTLDGSTPTTNSDEAAEGEIKITASDVFGEEYAKYGGPATVKVLATKAGYTARTGETTIMFEAAIETTFSPAKTYYTAGDELEFTISGLRPNKEVRVGLPIFVGDTQTELGFEMWASNQNVLTANMEVRDESGDTGLYYFGTTDENGVLTVSGTVGPNLPYGGLCYTLPDYGYVIDNPAGQIANIGDIVSEKKVVNANKGQYYDTIEEAINGASEGDTILVGSGEYDVVHKVDGTFRNYLWVNKEVTIKAAAMENKPVLKAKYESGYGKGSHQQATVEITADNVTLEGLVIHGIENYGDYAKVVEVTGANNFIIRDCDIPSITDDVTSIYLNGEGIGKYTIENNTMTGGIVPANGAGNGEGGEHSLIKDNTIGASISFTGHTSSGWDNISFNVYPTVEGNYIGGLDLGDGSRLLINSRDLDEEKLISDEVMNSILANNNFPEGIVAVVKDKYDESSQYYAGTHRRSLRLNPTIYNETNKKGYTTIQTAVEDAEAGDTILLNGDVTVEANSQGYGNALAGVRLDGISLDGGGNTLTVTGANTTWDCAIYITGGTIKDLTVGGAFRGIMAGSQTGDITIDNVVIDNVAYAFHSDQANDDYSVIINNSTLNGWTSYATGYKSVSFNNCILGQGTGTYTYAYIRPYSDTEFTNCEFSEGYKLDARKTSSIILSNCTVGDVELTQENLETLLGEHAVNATVE